MVALIVILSVLAYLLIGTIGSVFCGTDDKVLIGMVVVGWPYFVIFGAGMCIIYPLIKLSVYLRKFAQKWH